MVHRIATAFHVLQDQIYHQMGFAMDALQLAIFVLEVYVVNVRPTIIYIRATASRHVQFQPL